MASDKATPEQFQTALRNADMLGQKTEERIRALCEAIRARLDVGGDTSRSDAQVLLDIIGEEAFSTMNEINSAAEQLGCNYRGVEASHG